MSDSNEEQQVSACTRPRTTCFQITKFVIGVLTIQTNITNKQCRLNSKNVA